MRIQRYSDYRTLIRERLRALKSAGRGKNESLAKALGVSASQVSQILSGSRELSAEHACEVAKFLGLDELESEYFLSLVQLERTSSVALKKLLKTQFDRVCSLLEVREESSSLALDGQSLDEADKGVFYSQWYYSAIRQMSSVEGIDTPEKFAARLGLPLKKVKEAIEFLLRTGLCVRKDSRITLGPNRTYTQRGAPFHGRHHLNWRVKALEYLPKEQIQGLSYTAVVSLSHEDALKIREVLYQATERAESMIDSPRLQAVYCLAVDWFEL